MRNVIADREIRVGVLGAERGRSLANNARLSGMKLVAVCDNFKARLDRVCADMGVPCINAMDQTATGVKMTDASFRSKYCMNPNDISHLNADGMKLVFPVFEKAIADFYAAKTSSAS